MKKHTIRGLLIGIIILGLIYGYFKYTEYKRKQLMRNRGSGKYNPGNSSGGGDGTKVTADDFPLQKGDRGYKVEQLQAGINEHGVDIETMFKKITVDGIFGPETQGALVKLFGVTEVSEVFYNQITGKKEGLYASIIEQINEWYN